MRPCVPESSHMVAAAAMALSHTCKHAKRQTSQHREHATDWKPTVANSGNRTRGVGTSNARPGFHFSDIASYCKSTSAI